MRGQNCVTVHVHLLINRFNVSLILSIYKVTTTAAGTRLYHKRSKRLSKRTQ